MTDQNVNNLASTLATTHVSLPKEVQILVDFIEPRYEALRMRRSSEEIRNDWNAFLNEQIAKDFGNLPDSDKFVGDPYAFASLFGKAGRGLCSDCDTYCRAVTAFHSRRRQPDHNPTKQ